MDFWTILYGAGALIAMTIWYVRLPNDTRDMLHEQNLLKKSLVLLSVIIVSTAVWWIFAFTLTIKRLPEAAHWIAARFAPEYDE